MATALALLQVVRTKEEVAIISTSESGASLACLKGLA